MFDISAYAFAAQSVIAPMAGMVVVWNVLLAPFTLGEVLCVFQELCRMYFFPEHTRVKCIRTPSRKRGALLIVMGTACSGFFGNHLVHNRSVDQYLELFVRPLALLYYFVFGIISVVCIYYLAFGTHFWKGFSAVCPLMLLVEAMPMSLEFGHRVHGEGCWPAT
uniref:Uncharacterized protein n=2 Tax=Prymnesium polylepis TaxID=72548 RepID=A0A6V4T6P1_9EUKA|mmetsp:Transcript_44047/g.122012  ORF Transcript_44047/g.122012 Transcript_44047/m.122012 type:complete len:164 (-) Transcript_44047:893-1384(-)